MQKKQSVAIFSILDTPAFGGAEQYIFSHLKFLNQKGYYIILATNNNRVKEIMLSRLTSKEKKTFDIIRAPYRLDAIGNWKGLVKFFLALPRALIWCYATLYKLNKRYDRLICLWSGWSDRSIFSPLAKKFHCPLIWIEFSPLWPLYERNWGFPKTLFQIPSVLADHLISSSHYTLDSITENSRFDKNTTTLIYPGTKLFSMREIRNYRKKGNEWRKKEKVTKKILIGLVARLAHENEVDMVIRAIAFYVKKKTHSDILLLIIGDGPVRNDLEKLTADLGIDKYVRFMGFVSEEEKKIFLAACNFFIFPRAWVLDGFGMTTIEAMSLGIPILTTDFGPQIEIVTDGKEGYRYKPHDSQDLALHIDKTIKLTPKQREAMGKAGLRRVKAFSETRAHKLMLSVIKRFQNLP